MSFRSKLTKAIDSMRKRISKGLLVTAIISLSTITVATVFSIGCDSQALLTFLAVISALATSVFAACVVSIMFDIKSIRELIVRNDGELLLDMLLKSDELYSTTGNNSGQHKAILENMRLKSTAALNGIDLKVDPSDQDRAKLKEGHVRACLEELDNNLDKAYAKYVNIKRHVKRESDDVFKVEETIYVRYMNDTEGPKKISKWNYLNSGVLPDTFNHEDRDKLRERVSVTVNDGMPETYSHEYICTESQAEGIDAKARRWENDWDEKLAGTQVPPGGTCVVEMSRSFFIPAKEEIKHTMNTIRFQSRYEIIYDGDDCEPIIHILKCGKCDNDQKDDCTECYGRDDCRIIKDGNTKMAILSHWPNPGTVIKIDWVQYESASAEERSSQEC